VLQNIIKQMKQAEVSIYIDELRPKKDGKCSVKIKVSFNRKRKYFSTGIDLTVDEFEKVFNAKRRTVEQKEIEDKILVFENKAKDIIKKMPLFTFDAFEENYFEQRNTYNSVSFAFDKYIEQLEEEDRVGTASSYRCSKNSLEKFKKNLTFADVSAHFLKSYEEWMLKEGNNLTTIGIYVRNLRAIYNLQKIDKSLYPFGEAKDKYSIPTGKNIKKALTVEEIAKIYNYKADSKSTKEMAKDYWIFLYLCNGMNVKDFCLLKWGDIDGDMLTYNRAKTQRSKKESKSISVALKSETMEIIKKWGQPSISKDAYIFPHLELGMSAEKQRKTYQQLTKTINKYMKQIATELNLNKEVTTYFARHSFATVLKRSGANIGMISDLLGHSSVGVTESYLDGFEKEQIQAQTDVLTKGFQKAN
jgi:integrase/recombinase XerD